MPECGCTQNSGDPMIWLYLLIAAVIMWLILRSENNSPGEKEREEMTEEKQAPSHAYGKVLIVIALIAAIAGVFYLKFRENPSAINIASSQVEQPPDASRSSNTGFSGRFSESTEKLPGLLDLGAGRCLPCVMMESVLEKLKEEYAGQIKVNFIDIVKTPAAKKKYGIRTIPTQIFYSAEGKELFRHEGFYPEGEILKKWKELGITLKNPPAPREK